jgi:hypothetical protein
MASVATLQTMAKSLNNRQRGYLLAAYDEDQRRAAVLPSLSHRRAVPHWRWLSHARSRAA